MIIQTGDIIYVEPIRRPVSEGLRDYACFNYHAHKLDNLGDPDQ